jgi:hypothetical protein
MRKMRRYFLLLFFDGGGESIVECEADDEPRQIARARGAAIYRKYASRKAAERRLAQDLQHVETLGEPSLKRARGASHLT